MRRHETEGRELRGNLKDAWRDAEAVRRWVGLVISDSP